VEIETNDILSAAGIEPDGCSPVCHFSAGVDVISFGVERVD
jgi:hypothetical protein